MLVFVGLAADLHVTVHLNRISDHHRQVLSVQDLAFALRQTPNCYSTCGEGRLIWRVKSGDAGHFMGLTQTKRELKMLLKIC